MLPEGWGCTFRGQGGCCATLSRELSSLGHTGFVGPQAPTIWRHAKTKARGASRTAAGRTGPTGQLLLAEVWACPPPLGFLAS